MKPYFKPGEFVRYCADCPAAQRHEIYRVVEPAGIRYGLGLTPIEGRHGASVAQTAYLEPAFKVGDILETVEDDKPYYRKGDRVVVTKMTDTDISTQTLDGRYFLNVPNKFVPEKLRVAKERTPLPAWALGVFVYAIILALGLLGKFL